MFDPKKSAKIKETISVNRIRRVNMDIKVFELKIDEGKLSKVKLKRLNDCFIQAKWIYNYIIGAEKIFEFEDKNKEIAVNIFNPVSQKCDLVEMRNLTLGSQIKQSIVERAGQNVINLAKAKKAGSPIGKLKFKKQVNSIPLKQFGVTFRFHGKSHCSIQSIGKMRVSGLCQLKGHEIANAVLLKKATGYFIKVTCYVNKEILKLDGEIGLDFGIKDSIVTSNGDKYNFIFPIPKELKTKQKRLARKQKGSKNYSKQCSKIKKSYEKLTQKKNDAANKFVSSLKGYKLVAIQDENIQGWHANLFGKQVQQSILGRIKSKVKFLPTSIVLNRWLPTTKISPVDGSLIPMPLNQRIFQHEDYSEDRDIKSAKTILALARYNPRISAQELSNLPVEERTAIFYEIYPIKDKFIPAKQEAASL